MIWLPCLFIVWTVFRRNYAQSIDLSLKRHHGPAPLHNHPGFTDPYGSNVPECATVTDYTDIVPITSIRAAAPGETTTRKTFGLSTGGVTGKRDRAEGDLWPVHYISLAPWPDRS